MTLNVSHLKLLLQLLTWAPPAVQFNMPVPHPRVLSDLFDAKFIDRDADSNLVLTDDGQAAVALAIQGMQSRVAKTLNGSQKTEVPEGDFFYVIRYDDGAYNYGPEGSDQNGFPVVLEEASRYSTLAAAEQKAVNLRDSDGSGVTIVPVQTLRESHAA